MYYEIIVDGQSAYGPAPWSADHALSAVYERGHVLEAGLLGGVRFPLDAPGEGVTIGPVQIVASAEPDAPPPQPEAAPDLTKLQFLALFTDEEKVSLKALESTDPVVALFWEEYRTADSIRLDDPRVVRGLAYLVAAGHLAAERQAEILGGGA